MQKKESEKIRRNNIIDHYAQNASESLANTIMGIANRSPDSRKDATVKIASDYIKNTGKFDEKKLSDQIIKTLDSSFKSDFWIEEAFSAALQSKNALTKKGVGKNNTELQRSKNEFMKLVTDEFEKQGYGKFIIADGKIIPKNSDRINNLGNYDGPTDYELEFADKLASALLKEFNNRLAAYEESKRDKLIRVGNNKFIFYDKDLQNLYQNGKNSKGLMTAIKNAFNDPFKEESEPNA